MTADQSMSVADAVQALDDILAGDEEIAHGDADDILLRAAHPDVRDAYQRATERTGPWWWA